MLIINTIGDFREILMTFMKRREHENLDPEYIEALRRSVVQRQAHLLGGTELAEKMLHIDNRTHKQKKLSALLKAKRKTPEWEAKLLSTIKGVPKTDETKRRLSEAAKKRFATDDARRDWSLSRGGVMAKAFPLMIRGASNDEVMEITGIPRKSALKVRKRLVTSGRLQRHTPEETRQALSKAHSRKDLPDPRNISMANRLLDAGLVSDDPIYWNGLKALEAKTGIELPTLFADRLRLEIFILSFSRRINDPQDYEKYQQCGLTVDPQWFRITQIKDRQLLSMFSQKPHV